MLLTNVSLNNSKPMFFDDTMTPPQVGDVIHGYTLLDIIDNTNNSIIYKAKDPRTGMQVAIKFIKYREKCFSRVDEEVKLTSEIKSPFIIHPLEIFDSLPYKCIVMPLAITDLQKFISKSERIPEQSAKQIMLSALLALKYLHDRNICHRDIKLENLLIMNQKDNDEDVQLADLGFAKQAQNGEKFTEYLGTPMYAAPEVISGIPYDLSCDIWSMGVTLYKLLCGEFPFPSNPYQSKQMILQGSFFFPNNLWKDISKEARDLIRHMIRKNPKDRYTVDQCLSHPWFKDAHPRRSRAWSSVPTLPKITPTTCNSILA